MDRPRIRDHVSPVSLLGIALLVAIVFQAISDDDSPAVNAFESVVPVFLGGMILLIDRWMYRQGFDINEISRCFGHAIGGLVALMGLAIWLAILQRINGTRLGELGFVVIGAATVGAAAGLLVGVARVRHRQAIDSLDQQREQLESFASTVSHDLRSPLNVAMAKIEDVRSDLDHDQLDRTRSTLQRMDEILEGTLELARQGTIVRDPEIVDLAEVARTAWADIDTGDAEIVVDDIGTVPGDEAWLYQLFENLFRNAIDHGGSAVTLRVERLTDGFAVEDDGPGIPATIRDRVTERGFTARPNGSGLGLSIVQAIAVANGWRIPVTDGENGGARVELREVDR